jgi:succinate-semialdehyde dehydrogenase / glutarate-semialdehyde dehydrogenase
VTSRVSFNSFKRRSAILPNSRNAARRLSYDNPLFQEACLVDGQWSLAARGREQAVHSPATGALLGKIPELDADDVAKAIDSASVAFEAWRRSPAPRRAALLRAWFELIRANKELLAHILTAESGKPLAEARDEIDYAASYVEWYAEETRRVYGEILPGHLSDRRLLVIREPVGPVAAITSWNFPAALITRKAAPALAAGCTIIVKPSQKTPFSALALGKLSLQAGIPPGVFNIVTGNSREVGEQLLRDPRIRKLTFTGSTAVGKSLMRSCADTVKRLSLELGGNAPFIVFEDADVDRAVDGAMVSKFRNAGQTCVCANRFIVQRGVYDEFAEKLTARVANLKVGDGFDDGVQVGPLIDAAAVAKVEQHIADALSRGARVTVGGARLEAGENFFAPTVLRELRADMLIASEETFGPVAPLFCFDTEPEAIQLANNTQFGLAAYFYTRDIDRLWRVAERLECGMVGINTGLLSTAVAPFGGVKESGMGREGSRHGLDDFTSLKYLCLRVDETT